MEVVPFSSPTSLKEEKVGWNQEGERNITNCGDIPVLNPLMNCLTVQHPCTIPEDLHRNDTTQKVSLWYFQFTLLTVWSSGPTVGLLTSAPRDRQEGDVPRVFSSI